MRDDEFFRIKPLVLAVQLALDQIGREFHRECVRRYFEEIDRRARQATITFVEGR